MGKIILMIIGLIIPSFAGAEYNMWLTPEDVQNMYAQPQVQQQSSGFSVSDAIMLNNAMEANRQNQLDEEMAIRDYRHKQDQQDNQAEVDDLKREIEILKLKKELAELKKEQKK